MISRCIALTDQPRATNSAASQSSSSGWVGFFPVAPKLFGLPAMAWPKCQSQRRLTMTRGVSGFSGLAIQSARALRRPSIVVGIGSDPVVPSDDDVIDVVSTLRTPGATGLLGEN